MAYEEYETVCRNQQTRNKGYLSIFEDDLINEGLVAKNIEKHLFNIDFYINTFLLREEPLDMEQGCSGKVAEFLGCFFIHKCMWSTPRSIKTTSASIKKFYKSMLDHGYIQKRDYKELCEMIKKNILEWQYDCAVLKK